MKIRFGLRSLLVSLFMLTGAATRLCACSTTDETIVIGEIAFDGSFLGSCSGDASKVIEAGFCPTVCPGSQAEAFCVGTTYSECACISVSTQCDSGCCFPNPVSCTGKVAMTDLSERQCDAEFGYLLCNGTCYASFSCELPKGYAVATPDGGKDANVDSGASDSAPSDVAVESDSSDSASDAAGEDAAPDAEPPDAADAAPDAGAEAGGDAGGDGSNGDS
jgi:hypothetical protein